MANPSLIEVKKKLENAGINCYVEQLGDEVPIEVLNINLGKDEPGQEFIVQLNFTLELPEEIELEEFLEQVPNFLQFMVLLPFTYKEEAYHDLMHFLYRINSTLELPGFFVSDVDNAIYYRYVLCHFGKKVDAAQLISILRLIQTYQFMFAPYIKEIALREKTMEELLEEGEKMRKELGI